MITRLVRSAAACAAMALLAACESTPPEPIHRESTKEVRATVVNVQKAERLVSLQGADGRIVTVVVAPEARNFDQILVGDTVVATCYESIGFAVKDPSQATEPGSAVVVGGRAPAGERPAGVIGAVAETTVTFQSYDADTHLVTFTDEDGTTRTATVKREDGREFAKKLNRGDRVVITVEETVAIRVEAGK